MNTNNIITILGISILFLSCSPKKNIQQTPEVVLPEINVEGEQASKEDKKVERPIYNASETRKSDIIHTVLHVNFDWHNRQMHGKALIKAKPYFYPTDSLILDAKWMDIHSVKMNGSELSYNYDSLTLGIKLPKVYTRKEEYTIEIDYTANPERVKQKGSSAIQDAKGLYFINPDGKNPKQHQEIWTQGETESNSVWFPTIDNPIEKMTEEIYITVQDKYKTLSNGYLADSKMEGNGKRTDHWVMDQKHSPYLVMMTVGDFAVVKDKWKRKDGTEMEVNYYVEKKYEPHARAIFGETPNMISYFSKLLNYEYPWVKYSQVVVREYISGAMENTTATIHGDFLYQTKRELIDDNNESIIAHELFHHWFGDLVTCESWANLPLNESFANYSQYLWDEHKYGRMEADMNGYSEMEGYFLSAERGGHVDMIRYDYKNKEDMFDGHSYNKGGRILHMLRTYVGDEAFFESLNRYLTTNAYDNTEIAHLRLAFEKVTGEDMNWFFNQWFLASGHPIVRFEQEYNPENKELTIKIFQKQDFDKWPLYKLPIDIDIYTSKGVERKRVWADEVEEIITFKEINEKPLLVNIDATKTLLAKKADIKPKEQWIYQLDNAPLWLDKKEALTKIGNSSNDEAIKAVMRALNHSFWNVKTLAMSKLKKAKEAYPIEVKEKLTYLALNDSHPKVRARAITYLSRYFKGDTSLLSVYEQAIQDSSFAVIGEAINATYKLDTKKGFELAKKNEKAESFAINSIVASIYADEATAKEHEFFIQTLPELSTMKKYSFLQKYNLYLRNQNLEEKARAIPIYEDVAENSSAWFVKLSGYQLLNDLQNEFGKTVKELKDKENRTEKEEKDFTFATQKYNELEAILTRLKANETDSQVRRLLGL